MTGLIHLTYFRRGLRFTRHKDSGPIHKSNMPEQEIYIDPDELPKELYELKLPQDAVSVITAVYNYGPMNERRDYFMLSVSNDKSNWILWRSEDSYSDDDFHVCVILPKEQKDQTTAAAAMLESFWDTRTCNYDGEGAWDEVWGDEYVSDKLAMEIYERIWGSPKHD